MFINKVTFIFMYLSTYICTSITFSINVIYKIPIEMEMRYLFDQS